ncbi:acyl carrier protein [Dactylosporangium aurantiacum]|uniref:Acyl carrier protein n=1 Tax=Dactylosporangium aurantiacum TaxID=35754 RepID=A0A9Q9ILP6_9ACTN|nr:acyl carrier protein [Dactylosporangium aurantiacum]MDG6109123.1 acyl carrier protein [Dactylosporangium aurantiacum]UWZ58454.1 acyl carrier protein [Dactylosporangium aurantiacum]
MSTEVVVEVVAQLLDVDEEELTAQRPLAAIAGWDSVNSLRVLVYLERELNVSLDYERFVAAQTVGDLAAITADAQRAGARP